MNTILRRIILGILVLSAVFVGLWAAAFPESFYSSFPGFGQHWVGADGPYNEHLVRDVGGLYLGFAAAAVAAIVVRTTTAGRVIGVGWTLFGLLHICYHLGHPERTALAQVGTVVSLAVDLALGMLLILPLGASGARRATSTEAAR
jgi:hypothetical protein